MVATLRSLLSKQTCLHWVECVKKMNEMGVVYLFGTVTRAGFWGCDLIVCWVHNWPECPVEVIELSTLRVWGRRRE